MCSNGIPGVRVLRKMQYSQNLFIDSRNYRIQSLHLQVAAKLPFCIKCVFFYLIVVVLLVVLLVFVGGGAVFNSSGVGGGCGGKNLGLTGS